MEYILIDCETHMCEVLVVCKYCDFKYGSISCQGCKCYKSEKPKKKGKVL